MITFKVIAFRDGGTFEQPYATFQKAHDTKVDLSRKGYLALIVPVVVPKLNGVWS
jgi:hypothetical protein